MNPPEERVLERFIAARNAKKAARAEHGAQYRQYLKWSGRALEIPLSVIHLVGHTPGSVALLYEDPAGHPHLFTGDSLFPGGVGRTTSPADFASLVTDVETKLFGRLPDDTWFYPGHGNDSTLGAERPHLQEWRERGW